MAMQIIKDVIGQSSVGEVVKRLRSNKDKSEAELLHAEIETCKGELKSKVQSVKVTALQKATYFAMLGYNSEYASFTAIECLTSRNFSEKRTGYLAAACFFNDNTSVLPLCTASILRDFKSNNPHEVCLALYTLSSIVNADLAHDLVSEVVNLLSHSRPIVRKKAVLCLYKIVLQYPDALRPVFPKLKAKIEDGGEGTDSDPTVRGAVVNIFCELVRRNPGNFLNLVPPFFTLVTALHNNWTLIKVIKLLGCFVPLEPRLGKKLVEPITNLIATTGAKSVQYECLIAVATGMRSVAALLKLAVERIKPFAESRDPNLRYLGLECCSHIIKDPTGPKHLAELRESLGDSLTHNDPGIRSKALVLFGGLANKKNLVDTVNKMFEVVQSVADDSWSNLVIATIIDTISRNDYEQVQDFDWYAAVLVDLAQIQLSVFQHGARIESEFVVIATRVPETRPFILESLSGLLRNTTLLGCAQTAATSRDKDTANKMSQWCVLKAAAFLAGEFPQWLPKVKDTVTALMDEKITHAPSDLQSICVSAALKMFLFVNKPLPRHAEAILDADEEEVPFPEQPADRAALLADLQKLLLTAKITEKNGTVVTPTSGLFVFTRSVHADVQERALLAEFAVRNVQLHENGANAVVGTEVEAIVAGAQDHVELPTTVDLSVPFCDDLPALIGLNEKGEETSGDDTSSDSDDDGPSAHSAGRAAIEKRAQQAVEEEKRRRQDQKAFYLAGDTDTGAAAAAAADGGADGDGSNPGSPVGARFALANRAGKGAGAGGIRRPVSKPSNYVEKVGSGGAGEVVDEATLKLRGVKLGGPITKDDALPVATPYARVDPAALAAQSAAPSASAEAVAGVETKRIVAASNFVDPVEFFAADDANAAGVLQIDVQYCDSKLKKDGTIVVSAVATVRNLSDKHSLYTVGFSIGDMSGCDQQPPQLTDANGVSVASLTLCDKAKPATSISAEFSMLLDGRQSVAPVPVNVSFKAHKSEKTIGALLTLPVKLFMTLQSSDTVGITSDLFNQTVLPTKLAAAGSVSASIPLPAGKTELGKALLNKVCRRVGLSVVDVFKTSATLCGMMLHRKSTASDSYIALLLHVMDNEETGEKELTLVAKCNSAVMGEALLTEAAETVAVDISN